MINLDLNIKLSDDGEILSVSWVSNKTNGGITLKTEDLRDLLQENEEEILLDVAP